jgi:hypothetical protein
MKRQARSSLTGLIVGLSLIGCSRTALDGPPEPAATPASFDQAVELAGAISARVRFPASWTEVPAATGPRTLIRDQARGTLSIESAIDEQDALERWMHIEAENPAGVRYENVGGYPGLVRRHVGALPTVGTRANPDAHRAWYVTVAALAGNHLVRFEGISADMSSEAVVDELEQIGRSLTTSEAIPSWSRTAELLATFTARSAQRLSRQPAAVSPDDLISVGSQALSAASAPGANLRVNNGAGVDAEIEIAVSNDGRRILLANNSVDFALSEDYGVSFVQRTNFSAPGGNSGDPSLAVGATGTFYYAHINFPDPAPSRCATAITGSVITNVGGVETFNFQFQGLAAASPPTGMNVFFPDQEHIAADRTNLSATMQDQVYSVWRNFTPITPTPTTSCSFGRGFVTANISCSTDSGQNFTAPVAVEAGGDFPRITVGQDGSVWVVYLLNNAVRINRYSSCANGLQQQTGFPRTVATITPVDCSNLPGLDRCNDGNTLASPMVAVDTNNANHIFVSYASNTAANNEVIRIQDSIDGGATWRPAVQLNANVTGKRFMPWVCATGGTAFVSWYDQRAGVGGATNDLTDFFVNSAFLNAEGNLIAGTEVQLNGAADPLCASGWPGGARSPANSESCSAQPQRAGFCFDATPPDSFTRCDFSNCGPGGMGCECPAGEACNTFGGVPKYGDYNGIGCAGGRFYAGWASATPVVGATPDIDAFFACPPSQANVITFTDTTAPFFRVPPPPVPSNTCAVSLTAPVANDTCGTAAPTVSGPVPAVFVPGPNTVTWTATDAAGNTGTTTQVVTVTDMVKPKFTKVPPAITINNCTSANLGEVTATDDCGVPVITSNRPAKFPLGDFLVTYRATDGSGNFETATQLVTAILSDDASCCPNGTRQIIGNSSSNQLVGTSGSDCILGRGGDDVIDGRDGNDFISGGQGRDTIFAGNGNDRVYGNDGDDTINAAPGTNFIDGGAGTDTCFVGASDTALSCNP